MYEQYGPGYEEIQCPATGRGLRDTVRHVHEGLSVFPRAA
jgi:hypothetical protein